MVFQELCVPVVIPVVASPRNECVWTSGDPLRIASGNVGDEEHRTLDLKAVAPLNPGTDLTVTVQT